MKLEEAQKIVSKMIGWSMVSNGIISEEDDNYPEPITESLETLIEANRLVERENERQKELSSNGSRKISMTIADRGIAALYVAANFDPNDLRLEQADILAYHEGAAVLCVNYESCFSDNEEDDD